MFSVVCVCQPVCSQWGPHMATTHDAVDLAVQGSQPLLCQLGHQRLGQPEPSPPVDDIWRPLMETCSLQDTSHLPPVLTSGGMTI